MESRIKIKIHYLIMGVLIAVCFFMFTGFRLPSAPEPSGSYQFYREKDSDGVWVFEPDTGTSKYFDVEKGIVIINSFPMDSISVKTNVKTIEQKGWQISVDRWKLTKVLVSQYTLDGEEDTDHQMMLKKLMNKIFGGSLAGSSQDGFFLNARCSKCGEEFHLFVNRTTDLAQDFGENGKLAYFLNKEIIGANCRNLIHVRMKFGETKKLLSRNIENGEFID